LSACSGGDADDEHDKPAREDDDDEGIRHSAPDCATPAIAMTHHRYGDGHSLSVGFDLLAQAARPDADPLLQGLLTQALAATRPPPTAVLTGSVAAVRLALANQGIATPGQALIAPPADSRVLDPGQATLQADNRLLWPFDLAENADTALTVWWQLPEVIGPTVATAQLQVGVSPDLTDYDSLQLSLDLEPRPGLGDVVDALTALAAQNDRYADALEAVQKAQGALHRGHAGKALKAALKAADALSRLHQPQAAAVRRQLALAITTIERRL